LTAQLPHNSSDDLDTCDGLDTCDLSDASGLHMGAHMDELWELELSELAHDLDAEVQPGPRPETGLIKYIHRLREHYHAHIPEELPDRSLPKHARYLSHRYRGILSHLNHLVCPRLSRDERVQIWLRQHPDAQSYYRTTQRWHSTIKQELSVSVQYWAWVYKHHRLPHGIFHPRLTPFNQRPIAHPWESISECALEAMGTLEYELRL